MDEASYFTAAVLNFCNALMTSVWHERSRGELSRCDQEYNGAFCFESGQANTAWADSTSDAELRIQLISLYKYPGTTAFVLAVASANVGT